MNQNEHIGAQRLHGAFEQPGYAFCVVVACKLPALTGRVTHFSGRCNYTTGPWNVLQSTQRFNVVITAIGIAEIR